MWAAIGNIFRLVFEADSRETVVGSPAIGSNRTPGQTAVVERNEALGGCVLETKRPVRRPRIIARFLVCFPPRNANLPAAHHRLASGLGRPLADIEGMIHAARGEWRESERNFRDALETGEAACQILQLFLFEYFSCNCRRYLTNSLIRQGRIFEAEVIARESLTTILKGFGKNSLYTPYSVTTLAQIMDAQGRYAEAESLLRASLNIYAAIDHPPQAISVATARFQLGRTMVSLHKWDEAISEFERVGDSLTDESSVIYKQWVKQGIDVPLALVMAGKAEAAHRLISEQ